MAIEASLRVEGALIGNLQLIDSVIVDSLGSLRRFCDGSRQTTEGQSHEDAVEPYLVSVDGLMPIDFVGFGTWLVLQLFHEQHHSLKILLLGPLLIHTGHEMTGTDVVEIIVKDVKTCNVTLFADHLVGIHLAVLTDVLTAVAQIGVEHTFQFNTHHIAPLGFRGKVEHVTFGYALHFRVCQPLGIVLVRRILQDERTIDEQVVVSDVLCQANLMDGLVVDAVELTVLDGDVIDGVGQLRILIANNHHAVFRLLAGNILHRHVADGGVEATAANLTWFIVGVQFEDSLATLTNGNVAHIDVLNDTATTGVRLDAEYTVETGRVHLAILGIDILATAGNLRADDYTTMTVVHLTITDNDVLRGASGKFALTTLASVVVTAALDGDTVVASIEIAVFDKDAVACLWVATVTVGAVVVDMHATNGDVR